MKALRGTLLSDGASDRMLLPTIRWLLGDLGVGAVDLRWANPQLFPGTATGVAAKALAAMDQEPCDVLFIHRDAEKTGWKRRAQEIRDALNGNLSETTYVCIVPVRMTEAWLLFDAHAIRRAAGNPGGKQTLNLPPLKSVESQANPKRALERALLDATNLKGRHLKRFKQELGQAKHRVAGLIADFAPLRRLAAFQAFESELKGYLAYMESTAGSDLKC